MNEQEKKEASRKSLLECFKNLIGFDESKVTEVEGYPTFRIERYASCPFSCSDYFEYLKGSWLSEDIMMGWTLTDAGLRFLADTLKVNLIQDNDSISKTVKCYDYLTGRISLQIDRIYEQAKTSKRRRKFNNDCSRCPFMYSYQNYEAGDWDCECGVFGYDDPPDWACAANGEGCNLSRKTREQLKALNDELFSYTYYGLDVFTQLEEFEEHFGVDAITGEHKESEA